jgi:hypothetical protein
MSTAALAGNISGRSGNISGITAPGNISGIAAPGNISGIAATGNISGITVDIYGASLEVIVSLLA